MVLGVTGRSFNDDELPHDLLHRSVRWADEITNDDIDEGSEAGQWDAKKLHELLEDRQRIVNHI